MTDTVLQSFCERCGTRYTFTEQDTRRESGLSKIGRSLGLRSTPKPAGEPTVADALPTHDPFRATFHFCLQCRQYTCQNCWNADAGYCQTCYPLGEVDLRAAEKAAAADARRMTSAGTAAALATAAAPAVGDSATASAWPTSDLDQAVQASAVAPAPTSAPAAGPSDEPSPWGPAAVETARDDDWDVDRAIDDETVDPQGGHASVAAAILRAAEGPTPSVPGSAIDDRETEAGPSGVDDAEVGASVFGQTPVGTIDPWRGVVFSDEEPAAPSPVPVDEAPQLDPALPWLAQTDDDTSALDSDQVDETPLLTDDEDERDIDHRGWIAASTIATGSGWSAPVPPWPDESVTAATLAEDASASVDPTLGAGMAAQPEQPVSWIEPAVAAEVAGDEVAAEELATDELATDELATDASVVADDLGDTVADEAWPEDIEDELAAWPAADALPPIAASQVVEPTAMPDRDHEWVAPIVAASAAGAVIDWPRSSADEPGIEMPTVEQPTVELDDRPLDPAAVGSDVLPAPSWPPMPESQAGIPYVPISAGPFATPSPLAPAPVAPPMSPGDVMPAFMPPPPPVMPLHASAVPLATEALPPLAPPPTGYLPPPPATAPMAYAAYAAPMPPVPGVGLQAPVAAAAAAAAPAAAAAGQTKARPCQSCALPLSAKARFCRRCGAQQPV